MFPLELREREGETEGRQRHTQREKEREGDREMCNITYDHKSKQR